MDSAPLQFDRWIPLFPLPNCVLFPGVVQPLHIFEPRYREMVGEALQGQSAIAMALLIPGWEASYYGNPKVHPVVCVGQVLAHERQDDGKYNLLLHGVSRARLRCEQKQGLYRAALLEPLPDHSTVGSNNGLEEIERRTLRELFQKTALKNLTVSPCLATLLEKSPDEEEVPLTRIVDSLAFTLVQDVQRKQALLEELDPHRRCEKLLRELVSLAAIVESQPPPPPHAASRPALHIN
jgi:Lon protease-like protein